MAETLPMATPRTFAQWLRRERKAHELTQVELAQRAGIGRTYVTALESGSVLLPTQATRQSIHEVFGTSDQELVDIGIMAMDPYTGEYFATAHDDFTKKHDVPPPTRVLVTRESPSTGARESSADGSLTTDLPDQDAPLTPDELAELNNVFFTGLGSLEPRKLRAVLRALREGEP